MDEELSLKKVINEEDLKRKKMNIIVNENNTIDTKEYKIIKSKEIICQKCGNNATLIFSSFHFEQNAKKLINIRDYKINLYNCKMDTITIIYFFFFLKIFNI